VATDHLERRLEAILYADVAGYSRLTGADEIGTHKILSAYLDAFTILIEGYAGSVVHFAGDAILAEFRTVADSVNCAIAAQTDFEVRNAELSDDRKIQFRIGINLGDVIVDRDDIYGDGVNIAARLESLADPGGICVSDAVRVALGTGIPVELESLGLQAVKNIAEPVRAYKLRLKAGEAPRPPTLTVVPRRRRRSQFIAIATLLLLTVAVGLFFWQRPWETADTGSRDIAEPKFDKPSIAVLPFANMSGNKDEEYFADGMTDDLITDLSKISGLSVISRNAVFLYKGQAVDIPDVGKRLGVRYVLEGSVRRAGGRMRINAQLILVETGHHLWAERYDREYADIFALQDEVIEKIVGAMAVSLSANEHKTLVRIPTLNLEAYDNYLRAEQESFKGLRGSQGALNLYRKAFRIDPEFAEAYAGYARLAVDVWRFSYDQYLANPVAKKLAYEAASRALQLNPELPRAYSVLGLLQSVDGEHEQAIASGHRAVLLGPSSADAHVSFGLILSFAGRFSEAVESVETGVRIDPQLTPTLRSIAGVVWFLDRQFERALRAFETARMDMPGNEALSELLAMCYARLGRRDDARREIAAVLEVFPPLSTNHLRDFHGYFKRPEDLELVLGALRDAGVPDWPFGYEGRPEDRLNEAAVKDVTFGRTWSGVINREMPFIQEIDNTGTVAYRSASSFFTGEASVENGMLCLQSEVSLLGRKQCGYIYRNPESSSENRDGFIYVNGFSLMKFGLEQ
jgi:adenylate cyclase